jgi:type IV pilus assembly protein PilX
MKKPKLKQPKRPRNLSSLAQRGVTLIVAMGLLLVVSVIAAVTVKGSASSEIVANNARSQELAWQAAEAALRFCERGVRNQHVSTTTTATLTISDYTLPIAAAPTGLPPLWATPANWDATPSVAISVPLFRLDDAAAVAATSGITKESARFQGIYQRSPDCIAQYAGTGGPAGNVIWVVARGFGPEVPDNGLRPAGAEVFLQSTLDFNP